MAHNTPDVTIDGLIAELERLSEGWHPPTGEPLPIDSFTHSRDWSLGLLHSLMADSLWWWVSRKHKKPLVVRIHDSLGGKLFRDEAHLWYWTVAHVFMDWEGWVVASYVREHPDQLLSKVSKLFNDADTQVMLLRWWVRWQGLTLSDQDLCRRLAPQAGLYLWNGIWQDSYSPRWDPPSLSVIRHGYWTPLRDNREDTT